MGRLGYNAGTGKDARFLANREEKYGRGLHVRGEMGLHSLPWMG